MSAFRKIILAMMIVSWVAILVTSPRFEVALILTALMLSLILSQRTEPTLEEVREAYRQWLPKWESENIKLSDIGNLADEKAKKKYADKFRRDLFSLEIEANKLAKRRPIGFYIKLPKDVDLGLVDEVFGILIAVFLAETILKINAHLLIQFLIVVLIALLISCVALGAVAVKGREVFYLLAIAIVGVLIYLIRVVQPEIYNENAFKFLGFSVLFWYAAKEIVRRIAGRLAQGES